MLNIISLIIFLIVMLGNISFFGGKIIPIGVPVGITIIDMVLLLYSLKKGSRIIYLQSTAFWLGFTWGAGLYIAASWGQGWLAQSFIGLLTLATPLAAVAPYFTKKRFASAHPGRHLELSKTETDSSLFQQFKEKIKNKQHGQPKQEMLLFDLGEEVQYKNK